MTASIATQPIVGLVKYDVDEAVLAATRERCETLTADTPKGYEEVRVAIAALRETNLAHWVQSRAFALAPVGALAPYEYTSLIWGSAVGWLLFGELPTRDALLGAAIVTAAGLYNLHREQLRKREEARMDGSG